MDILHLNEKITLNIWVYFNLERFLELLQTTIYPIKNTYPIN